MADRLTTNRLTNLPFEKVANKNILFFASNSVVALAYTGDAHLDNIPTDYWIAEKLSGIKFNPENPHMMKTCENNNQDVGWALRNLSNELANHSRSEHLFLLISIQGWQWNSKGRLRPLVGYITKLPPENTFGVHYEPRDWYFKGAQTISAPKSIMTIAELTELSNSLRNKPALESENLLVEKIREVSRHKSWVGPHCVSILIPPPSEPNIFVRYHPADHLKLIESQKLANDQQIWAYSPWIISPRMCMPPNEVTGGGFTISTGLFTIHFSSETPKHPKWLFSASGQKRRRIR
ncbi:MAG: hypothetical protein FVQ83_16880 [Chloroflexi bacterium]|nr:hypothetical protein [Chloroflexota bacterium]